MLLSAIVIMGSLLFLLCVVGFLTWHDPWGQRMACAKVGFGCGAIPVFVGSRFSPEGSVAAIAVGLAYFAGCYGYVVAQEYMHDKMATSIALFTLLPLSPVVFSWLYFVGKRDAKASRELADIQRREDLWREEFRQSGLSDPTVFKAFNPEALKPRVLIRNEEHGMAPRDWNVPSHSVKRALESVEGRRVRDSKRRR